MVTRRDFVAAGTIGAVGVAGVRRTAELNAAGVAPARQDDRLIVDALGEVRIEYAMDVIDAIRDSGLRACVVTTGNPALYGATAFLDTLDEIAAYDRHIEAHSDRLSQVRRDADIDRSVRSGTIGLIYYPQNATPVGDDLDRVQVLYEHGVRLMQLTYNHRNLLGDGCLERTNAGLSTFGLEVVERMNAVGMVVDVSHCGPATTMDGIVHSTKPVAITHSTCRAVYDHPRAKSDEVLRALAERGGVIGICQLNPFLGPRERNTLEDYLDHIAHAVDVAGVEHVAIGSDREYKTIPDTVAEKQKLVDELARLGPVTMASVRWPYFLSELNHPRRMETIIAGLRGRGRSERDIDMIMGQNFRRVFRDVVG